MKPRPELEVRPSDYKCQHTVPQLSKVSLPGRQITLAPVHPTIQSIARTWNYGSHNPSDPSRFLFPECNELPFALWPPNPTPLRIANWGLKSAVRLR